MSLPILDFDPTREVRIEPSRLIKRTDAPKHCVICFFAEVIADTVRDRSAKMIAETRWEDGPHFFYEIEHSGKRLAFFHPGIGSAFASGLLEEAIALGCTKFVACGGCGVLEKGIGIGHLICVSAAVRDEGASYHYLPPSNTVEANPIVLETIENFLRSRQIPFLKGLTWSTDAPYRETQNIIEKRKKDGCIVVDMEAAGMIAVAQFRKVSFGQIMYAGDDLSGAEWDNRKWSSRKEVREKLFWTSADAVLLL